MKRTATVLIAAAALSLAACTTTDDTPTPSASPTQTESTSPTPSVSPTTDISVEDAIRIFLARDSIVYAGNCTETDIETDIGKYCSTIINQGQDEATVDIGPTFSEYTTRLSLVREPGGWRVGDAVPIEFPIILGPTDGATVE